MNTITVSHTSFHKYVFLLIPFPCGQASEVRIMGTRDKISKLECVILQKACKGGCQKSLLYKGNKMWKEKRPLSVAVKLGTLS